MKVNAAGSNLYFEAYGRGDPILFLHGWGADHQIWQPLLPHLSPLPFQLLILDLPGFGQSVPLPKPFTLADYTQVAAAFAKELELSHLTLVGHSFGGKIAISYALNHPLKKLVLIDGAGIKRRGFKTRILLNAARSFRLLDLKPLNLLRRRAAPYFQAKDYRQISNADLRDTFRLTVEEDLRNKIKNINTPTLLIWGGEDTETPLRDAAIMKKEIKKSILKIIPESGHFPFLDHPEVVAKLIVEFLEQP